MKTPAAAPQALVRACAWLLRASGRHGARLGRSGVHLLLSSFSVYFFLRFILPVLYSVKLLTNIASFTFIVLLLVIFSIIIFTLSFWSLYFVSFLLSLLFHYFYTIFFLHSIISFFLVNLWLISSHKISLPFNNGIFVNFIIPPFSYGIFRIYNLISLSFILEVFSLLFSLLIRFYFLVFWSMFGNFLSHFIAPFTPTPRLAPFLLQPLRLHNFFFYPFSVSYNPFLFLVFCTQVFLITIPPFLLSFSCRFVSCYLYISFLHSSYLVFL